MWKTFLVGFFLPFHLFIKRLLISYELVPTQIHPNA